MTTPPPPVCWVEEENGIFFPCSIYIQDSIPSTGDQALSVRLRGLLKGCCRADEVPAIFHSLVPGYVCDQDLATGHPTSAEIYLWICKQTKAILQCVLQSWKKKHQTMRRHFICGHEKGRQIFNVFCRAKTQRVHKRYRKNSIPGCHRNTSFRNSFLCSERGVW